MLKEYNPYLSYENGELTLEGVPLKELAREFGTPLFVYSASFIKDRLRAYREAFPDALICYAVKANFNPHLVSLLAREGAGADVVSGGELYLALRSGVPPERIVYAGVGKTEREMLQALRAGILAFNVESFQELEVLSKLASKEGKVARVCVRVNPDVDPKTHPYVATGLKESKFGIDASEAKEAFRLARELPNVEPIGLHVHIGSQLLELSPYREAVLKVYELYRELKREGYNLELLDVGGGLGIKYRPEDREPTPHELAAVLNEVLTGFDGKLVLEPGRSLVGNAGLLITQVQFTKEKGGKRFAVVDAGMNDLIRPAFYGSYHHAVTLEERPERYEWEVVGPICETGDFLAKNRRLPELKRGDYLAFLSAGAYAFAMSSHYNFRPRAAELLVEKGEVRLIRRREDYEYVISPCF
ncbi:MAG: diaminopimelate decarboxylase [Aquificae bacterium]|nr:diaminopimelate decarboxylase [Aquificota bacterium]